MTPEQFKALKPGDLVRHKASPEAMIVHANYGDRVTAVRTSDLTNPNEWDQVRPDGSVIADFSKAVPKWEDGFHWFKSERSSQRAVGQYLNGHWYIMGEGNPIDYSELIGRGWEVDSYIGPADTMAEDED